MSKYLKTHCVDHPRDHIVDGEVGSGGGAPGGQRLKYHGGILACQPTAAKVRLGVHGSCNAIELMMRAR